MSLIIAATDFTETSNHALQYAGFLATEYKMPLTVLHSYTIPVAIGEAPMPVLSVEECRQVAEKSMAELMDTLTVTFPDIAVNSVVLFGNITDTLAEYAKDKSPWMLVVGNSLNDEDSIWFAGNLLNMMRELPFPVLAVPNGGTYRPVKKICFACDYKKDTEQLPLASIAAIAGATGAQLHVLNVDHDNEHFNTDTPEVNEILHNKLSAAKPEYHYAEGVNTDETIQAFVNSNHIDWLIVAPHKHSFFAGLFHKSHTKALARTINVPLLSLH